jgi:hypothetical protein
MMAAIEVGASREQGSQLLKRLTDYLELPALFFAARRRLFIYVIPPW